MDDEYANDMGAKKRAIYIIVRTDYINAPFEWKSNQVFYYEPKFNYKWGF